MKTYIKPQTQHVQVEFIAGLCAVSEVNAVTINPNGPQIIESE